MESLNVYRKAVQNLQVVFLQQFLRNKLERYQLINRGIISEVVPLKISEGILEASEQKVLNKFHKKFVKQFPDGFWRNFQKNILRIF